MTETFFREGCWTLAIRDSAGVIVRVNVALPVDADRVDIEAAAAEILGVDRLSEVTR